MCDLITDSTFSDWIAALDWRVQRSWVWNVNKQSVAKEQQNENQKGSIHLNKEPT